MKRPAIAALLTFNGGFVDTAGFLGLEGLFTAHVTGNFVTLGAALVFGSQGIIAKVIALPEFVAVVALAHLTGRLLERHGIPSFRILLGAKTALLLAFFLLAVTLGPFPDSDTPAALLTGFAGIAAMAVQNAVHRTHLASAPPTTLMTGTTTQVALDAVDVLFGIDRDRAAATRARLGRLLYAVIYFAAGCALAALLYAWVGFWCLALPVAVSLMALVTRASD